MRITCMHWKDKRVHHKNTVILHLKHAPSLAAASEFNTDDFTLRTEKTVVTNETRTIANALSETSDKGTTAVYHHLRSNIRRSRNNHWEYVHTYMVESQFASDVHIPCVQGLPQLCNVTPSIVHCWCNAVTYACIILGLPKIPEGLITYPPKSPLDPNECVLAVALRILAGTYPLRAETVDDRTLGTLRLNTNRDCDDMAIQVAASVNALLDSKCPPIHAAQHTCLAYKYAGQLLDHLRCHFSACWLVYGRATPKVKDPNCSPDDKEFGGHVWAILRRNTEKNHVHIECTRSTTAHPVSSVREYKDSKGNTVFTRDQPTNTAHTTVNGVMPLFCHKYRPVSMYSHDAMYLATSYTDPPDTHMEKTLKGDMKWVSFVCTDLPNKKERDIYDATRHRVDDTDADAFVLANKRWAARLCEDSATRELHSITQDQYTRFVQKATHIYGTTVSHGSPLRVSAANTVSFICRP